MRGKAGKVANAAHIKRNTKGTSNEISFSVLDAAKAAQEEERRASKPASPLARLGSIHLFTLGRVRKPVATPTKERGLPLSTGEFVSVENGQVKESSTPKTVPGITVEGSPSPDAARGADAAVGAGVGAADAAAAGGAHVGGAHSAAADSSSSRSGASLAALAGAPEARVASGARAARGTSSPAISATPWETPYEEVARRKAKRKRRRRAALAGMILVLVLAAAAGATTLYAGFQLQQDKKGQLTALVQELEQIDEAILPFDEVVVKASSKSLEQLESEGFSTSFSQAGEGQLPTGGQAGEQRAAGQGDQLDEAAQDLAEVKQAIESLQTGIVDNETKEAANQALISINARSNMIQSGSAALEETYRALDALALVQEGWDLILQGDAAARAAASLIADASVDNVNTSMSKSNEAVSLFSQAREKLVAAQEAYGADLEPFIRYVDLRVESQNLALTSDQAYLDRDKEALFDANEAYNEVDAEAVALIKEQKSSPQVLVSRRFEDNARGNFDSYLADRARAANADAFLRDYLGSMGK